MKTIINQTAFEKGDSRITDFYNEHGWVVIEGVLNPDDQVAVLHQWNTMKQRFASEMQLSLEDYESEVSQWRDLWLQQGPFHDLIHQPDSLHNVAMDGMGWQGIRLLHDHLIAKPRGGSNKKIPWHQDSMFWPVDLPGCSSWTALQNVGTKDGCLEVIDCSHLEGCEQPVDFMATEREDFPEDAVRALLPVSAGSMILLHSLTWHRSSPNLGATNRPAHLALWVHPDARWRPDLVDWHPVNDHVESEPGTRMEGFKFPMFGVIEESPAPVLDIHSGTVRESGISMFDASKIVGNQISEILGVKGDLSTLLASQENREEIIRNSVTAGFCKDRESLANVLQRLWVSFSAYKLHRARNVYNDAYATWWDLVGSQWEEKLQ